MRPKSTWSSEPGSPSLTLTVVLAAPKPQRWVAKRLRVR